MNLSRTISMATAAVAITLLTSNVSLATTTSPPTPSSGCTIIQRGGIGNIRDAYIWELYPNYNTGTSVDLYTGLSSSGGEKRTVMGFDLASIPSGSIVSSAILYVSIFSNTTQQVRAHQVLNPWTESTVTWNNIGAIDPVPTSSFISGGAGYRPMDLTNLVQAWISGRSPNYGILLEEAITGSTLIKSSESTSADRKPYLEVCYGPPLKSTLGDLVWFDRNADGSKDESEPGISGVVIDLFADAGCDGIADGAMLTSATTDMAGSYHFTDLNAGCYVAVVNEGSLPVGHWLTTGNEPLAVSLEPGENRVNADFGYVTFSSIGDIVWLDSDGDGVYERDAGEVGVNDVLVELYRDGSLVDFTYTGISPYTGESGFYLFTSLPQGNYTVVVHEGNFAVDGPLFGYVSTVDTGSSPQNAMTVSLAWAQDIVTVDFGYEPSCGDGTCGGGEDCGSCAADCGACPPVCGDGACNGGEDCSSCSSDCGSCPASCGDGTCNGSEDCSTCATDCGTCAPVCGDGVCNGDEGCASCAADCGACPAACGDEVCNGDESCYSCPGDCGLCPVVCGDGLCGMGETCSNCGTDCGACPPVCGDGTCGAGTEDCLSCAADCGSCPIVVGTGTIGYWMNHPSAWPVTTLTIGGRVYTQAELISIMKHPTKKDMTYSMAEQLIAAKLNVGIGSLSTCVEETIRNADAWLAQYPLGSNVKAGTVSSPWTSGEPLKSTLDAYNNGLLCAPHRG